MRVHVKDGDAPATVFGVPLTMDLLIKLIALLFALGLLFGKMDTNRDVLAAQVDANRQILETEIQAINQRVTRMETKLDQLK